MTHHRSSNKHELWLRANFIEQIIYTYYWICQPENELQGWCSLLPRVLYLLIHTLCPALSCSTPVQPLDSQLFPATRIGSIVEFRAAIHNQLRIEPMARIGQDCPCKHEDAVGWSSGRSHWWHCRPSRCWRRFYRIPLSRRPLTISCPLSSTAEKATFPVQKRKRYDSVIWQASIPKTNQLKQGSNTKTPSTSSITNDVWLIEWIKANVNQQIHVISWLKTGYCHGWFQLY